MGVGGVPGDAVVGSPPANAGDAGLSPGLGGSRMPRSHWARVPQLLSLRPEAREPQLLSPHAALLRPAPGARAPRWERPPRQGVAPARCNWRGPARSSEDPMQSKINK